MVKFLSLVFATAASAGLAYVLYIAAELDPVLAWFGGVNIVIFLIMAKDKMAAKTGVGRTPERTLFILAVAGGFPGLFAARKIFNHKTTKKKFILTMWFLFAIQLVGVAYYFYVSPEKMGLTPKTSNSAIQTR